MRPSADMGYPACLLAGVPMDLHNRLCNGAVAGDRARVAGALRAIRRQLGRPFGQDAMAYVRWIGYPAARGRLEAFPGQPADAFGRLIEGRATDCHGCGDATDGTTVDAGGSFYCPGCTS